MKTILITGCAGFIGSNLAEELLKRGDKIIGFDNLMTGHKKNIEKLEKYENFEFVWGDIRDLNSLNVIIKKYQITHISHQAARGSVPKSVENPILTHDINITGTLNILWSAKENNIGKVVCAISSSVYGNTPILPKIEDMNYNPLSPYAVTKSTCEMYCKVFYEIYGLKTIGLRYFNVYGKRQDPNGDYAAVIPKWIKSAKNNKELLLNGEGNQTRDFTFIEDIVQLNIKALDSQNSEAYGKGFNGAYGHQISIKELAEIIIKVTKSTSKILTVPERKGDIQDSFADINLAKDLLGYKPQFSMEKGLDKTIKWYLENLK
jgi:UDP-N-acetylglucosamine 4-epimerase